MLFVFDKFYKFFVCGILHLALNEGDTRTVAELLSGVTISDVAADETTLTQSVMVTAADGTVTDLTASSLEFDGDDAVAQLPRGFFELV